MSDTQNEATKEAIKEIISNGVDLSRPMTIDFFVAFSDKDNAERFTKDNRLTNFRLSVEKDENSDYFTCYCSTVLMLQMDIVVEAELLLSSVAQEYQGELDGFGTYGNLQD